MNADEPLLSASIKSSTPPRTPSKRIGSLRGCLCPNASFSSSAFEDTPKNLTDVEDKDVINNEEDLKDSSPVNSKLYSADSQYLFPLECTPQHRIRKRMVSWGGSLEIQQGFAVSDKPRASSRVHEIVNKSQRFRTKSMQLDVDLAEEENPRLIYVNDPRKTNDKYECIGNEVRTSKYTILNFLPKNLFMQFHRLAYLYFLAIAALNQLPPLAVFGRTVSLFPLLIVLSVTAVKDGYEDWRRHRSDQNENNRMALVLQLGKFELKKWKNIKPGEVVKICADETIPCDMVLLGTSDPNGIAYIQTMNLDGESNLKTRYARQETTSMVLQGGTFSGIIRCEQPNRNIYEFAANMEFKELRFPLSQSNIVLRGCQLKNTDWVVGVVVYAGQETKAMLNSAMTPAKRSRLETYMNRETFWLSVFLFVMCLVVSIGMCLWLLSRKNQLDTLPYYRKSYFGRHSPGKYRFYGIPMETFFSFLSSIIVFQIMIPISLYLTMELVRLGQSYFMIEDRHLFDSSSNSRFQCRSLNINEDLGQIRYVFSDKTGTLTENKMEFRKACIHGKSYGSSMLMADGLQCSDIAARPEAPVSGRRWMLKSNINVDPELMALLKKGGIDQRNATHDFFLTLATCNTVIPILTQTPSLSCSEDELQEVVEAIDYQGESPDEQALVSAASAYGYTLFERTSGHVSIDVNGEQLRLCVLGLHEFDSVRKRMSVVVRFPDNSVRVLVKGADTSMMSIIKENSRDDEHSKCATHNNLNKYSSEGLRTLVLAARDLTEVELDEWQSMYEDASTSLTDRTIKLREVAALIECDLHLLGATAIEDKLQEGVPETIEALRQAGIKVWVLTGDKQETAISIGVSCKLLTSDMQQIIINGSSEEECRYLLTESMVKYGVKSSYCENWNMDLKKSDEVGHQLEISDGGKVSKSQWIHTGREGDATTDPLALIIDGNSLVYILEKELENELFDLATFCRVVLCCRVAPLQKAGIVDLIKSRTDDMTLAIGDGANDVSMIQMADVGVGICGQEGRQAVLASDFAMGQFRFLKRLLLVHGHWNYQRIGYLVLYNFYKNAVFVFMLFWYILCTGFSTTSALTDWSSMFYSIVYTSVPTVIVGILDKDLSHRTLLKYPKLYESGHRHESYNIYLFWGIMFDTIWQSLVLYYIPVFIYKESTIDIWSMGSLWTIAVVILVNVHLAMDIQRWLVLTHLAVWGSVVITYACIVVLDSIPIFPNYGTIYHLATSPTYWLSIMLILVLALLPRFVFKLIYLTFWPSDIQIAREAEVLGRRPNFIGSRPDNGSS